MNYARVTQTDIAEVEAFLLGRAEHAMFPLSNLAQFGLDGENDLSPRMWRNVDGPVSDVLCVSKAGMVLPYLPSGGFEHAAKALSGRSLIGVIGPAASARGMQAALGMSCVATQLDASEGHYCLVLDDLTVPDGDSHLLAASEELRPVLTKWLTDYHINIMGQSPTKAAATVPNRITGEIADGRRVVLMDGDRPVATTGFSAALPQIVLVGGVYTPPESRGKRYARRALALHLDQARSVGIKRATLAADAPSAIAAYRSVGFKQIGDAVMTIFTTPQIAQGPAT